MSTLNSGNLELDVQKCRVCNHNTHELTDTLKERLKKILRGSSTRNKSSRLHKSSVIETVDPDVDWTPDKDNNNTELITKDSWCYGTFESDCVDRSLCDELTVLLHGCLQQAQDTSLRRHVLLPQGLLHDLAVDIIRMARSEPYGLRGAVLYLDLEQEEGHTNLGRVECNSHVASTFEVHVTLKEDIRRWCTIKDLVVRGLFGCKDTELYLAPGYKLVKHKLYRSNSAVSC